MKLKIIIGLVMLGILSGCGNSDLQASLSVSEPGPLVLDSNNSKYKLAIKQSVLANSSSGGSSARIGVTSHHLPVASEFIGEFYNEFLSTENNSTQTIVVIGPDHPEKCSGSFTTGRVSYKTNFGILESDESLVGEMLKSDLINDEASCLEREHSIGVQADYINYILPEAKIVPLVVSSSATVEETRKVTDLLSRFYRDALFIVSVDFNHFRTESQASVYDQDTIEAIESMSVNDLTIDHVDSPPSLRMAVELAKLVKANPRIFGYTNSYEYTGQFGNTTSYLNVLFEEGESK